MSTIIPAYLSKQQLKRINEHIPVSKRSRLISEFILEHKFQLPGTKEKIEKILEWEENAEKVILPIFFSESAVRTIDEQVQQLKEQMQKFQISGYVGRSTIIRFILEDFATYVQEHSFEESEKQFILIHVPAGTKKKLDEQIDKMERSHTIDSFLSEAYLAPEVSVQALKARFKGEKEKIALYLSLESLEKAERIAESFSGQKVKKTHIIRDAIYQLMEQLDIESPKKRELEETLTRTLDDLMKHADPGEIKEILARYNTKE